VLQSLLKLLLLMNQPTQLGRHVEPALPDSIQAFSDLSADLWIARNVIAACAMVCHVYLSPGNASPPGGMEGDAARYTHIIEYTVEHASGGTMEFSTHRIEQQTCIENPLLHSFN